MTKLLATDHEKLRTSLSKFHFPAGFGTVKRLSYIVNGSPSAPPYVGSQLPRVFCTPAPLDPFTRNFSPRKPQSTPQRGERSHLCPKKYANCRAMPSSRV